MDYIKLSRKILEWEWWDDINTCRLFIYCLLKANWKDGRFKGMVIPKGSFVSSIPKMSDETSLTIREIRTAISHLKSTGEVTCKSYAKYTVFTVKNYCEYQQSDLQNDRQATGKRHSNDMLTTTIEEYKEGKNNKKEDTNVSKKKFVPPTVEEVRAYCQERGNKVDPQAFVDHYTSNGWMVGKNKMKSWKAAVGTWERSSWQSREAPAQKKYNANKGMMTSNYGDMSEFEKSMLAN
ncbi:MAG: hypothetical protein PUK30_00530 [Dorea formicigenerans]|nr:hypothetical protein [Dorea formicigenerans]